MVDSKTRFCIVGCGRIGRRHAEIIIKNYRLAAVCDILQDRAAHFGAEFNCRHYSDFEQMLKKEKADVLVVCTPNYLHAVHSIAGMGAGLHVLCEKPMAISVEDALSMKSVSLATGRKLHIVKQNRFNPPVVFLNKLLSCGSLGKISSFHLNGFWNRDISYYENCWHSAKATDGGMLYTQFSHFIDIMIWMLGSPENISGMSGNFLHEGVADYEDTAVFSVRLPGGTLGGLHFTVNSYRRNMEGSLTVFGEKGTIKIGGPYLNKLEFMEVEGLENVVLDAGNPPNDYGSYKGSMSNHPEVYKNFVENIHSRNNHANDHEVAFETVKVIARMYEALNHKSS